MKFWAGKRVLITGHTGFKGSWLSEILLGLGADVFGLSLKPETNPSLFNQLKLSSRMEHRICDIRDFSLVREVVQHARPQITFHLAAQPLVRRSYIEPIDTWSSNVMGTVHVLEALRLLDIPSVIVAVTTDKVYENLEWEHPYRETDQLGGHDPYSASKAATELVASSWRSSFLSQSAIRLATARAGNVIGGGDWSVDRIMPDLVRAISAGETLKIRNRNAVRPWQHVLDPLHGYLLLAEALSSSNGATFESGFNFGPELNDQRSVEELVECALGYWPGSWSDVSNSGAVHEASRLSLSIEKARSLLGWSPRWNFDTSVAAAVTWYRDVENGAEASVLARQQISDFGLVA